MAQVLTWSGSGYGSGTSRTLYLNGAPYGTAQVPESYRGREEAYFRSQYNPQGIVTREQAGEQAYEQGIAQTRVQQLAERARHEAYAQEQRSLKSAFVPSGREAPRSVIGIEQAKQSERRDIEGRQYLGSIEKQYGQKFQQIDLNRLTGPQVSKLEGYGYVTTKQAQPKPGEYGYHATPTRPGGISTEFAPTSSSQYFKMPVNQIGIKQTIGQYGAQPGSIAQMEAVSTIQKAGFIRTGGAILSSTELFSKAAETQIRGVAGLAGFKSKYPESVSELMTKTAQRLRERPSIGRVALESPLTAAIPIGAGFKIGSYVARASLLKGASIAGKVSKKAAKPFIYGEKLVEPALTVGSAAYVGYDVAKSRDVYQAGGKLAGYAAMTPGAMAGWRATTKAIDTGVAIGSYPKEFLSQLKDLKSFKPPIQEAVLSGEQAFPMTRAGSFERFKPEFETPEGKYAGYHATPSAFTKGEMSVRALQPHELRGKDVPGLYISPYKQGASPYFLRLQQPSESIKNMLSYESFKSSSSFKPQLNLIRDITDIRRIPGGKNVQKSREFLYTQGAKAGEKVSQEVIKRMGYTDATGRNVRANRNIRYTEAWIEPKIELGGFRGEAQGVLSPGAILGPEKSAKLIWAQGRLIPLVERSVIGNEAGKIPASPLSTKQSSILKGLRQKQYYEPEYPLRAIPVSLSASQYKSLTSKSTSSYKSVQSYLEKLYSKQLSSYVTSQTSRVLVSSGYKPGYSQKSSTSYKSTGSYKTPASSFISQISSKLSPASSKTTMGSRRPLITKRPGSYVYRPGGGYPSITTRYPKRESSYYKNTGKSRLIPKDFYKYFRFTASKTIEQFKKGLISDITKKKKRKKTTGKRTTKKKSKR